MRGLIQVAGVIDWEEARMLVEEGVRQLGFPLRLPVHREDLSDDEAARIVRRLPASASAILITYLDEARGIVGLCEKLGVGSVQVHGDISMEEAARLRRIAPELRIFKSLVVRGDNLRELEAMVDGFHPHVDAFITDTFDPSTTASGATGKTHDWSISRRLVEMSPRPVILAGGLTPQNVRRAIGEVRPAGVDVHTGVEGRDGRKDRLLVRAFVAGAVEAFAGIGNE